MSVKKYIHECSEGQCEYSLSCPICGHEYDIEEITTVFFEQGKSFGKKIFFFCPLNGCLFSINFYFHKGKFYIEAENEKENIEAEKKELAGKEADLASLKEKITYLAGKIRDRENAYSVLKSREEKTHA